MATGKWAQFTEEQKDQLLDSLEGQLYNHPEVGHTVKEAVEKAFGYTDPELALTRRHQKEVDSLREQITSLETKTVEKEIRARVDGERDAAKAKFKLTDDQMKEVSKLMIDQGIGNYNTAAEYYSLQRQAAKPTTDNIVEHSSLSLPDNADLFKDKNAWARKEAYKVINEIQRNRS